MDALPTMIKSPTAGGVGGGFSMKELLELREKAASVAGMVAAAAVRAQNSPTLVVDDGQDKEDSPQEEEAKQEDRQDRQEEPQSSLPEQSIQTEIKKEPGSTDADKAAAVAAAAFFSHPYSKWMQAADRFTLTGKITAQKKNTIHQLTTMLSTPHLDLSRCPLLHKSLQPPCITD